MTEPDVPITPDGMPQAAAMATTTDSASPEPAGTPPVGRPGWVVPVIAALVVLLAGSVALGAFTHPH